MTTEDFVNKYGEPFFEATKLGEFYYDVDKLHSERIAELESQLKEVKEENRHLSNYAVHTQFCAWINNGNGICDCGYIKNQN